MLIQSERIYDQLHSYRCDCVEYRTVGNGHFFCYLRSNQQIKEGEQTSNVKATYTVKVHVDADGDMVIVQTLTLAPAIEKSDYDLRHQKHA